MPQTIIRIANLTKKFGNLVTVDDLNLKIEEGQILGLFKILNWNRMNRTCMQLAF